jgi:hypothetical protein
MKFIVLGCCLVVAFVNRGLAQDDVPNYPPPSRDTEVALFNGRDFTGFTFCMKDNADPMQTWSVTNGVIHCTGKPMLQQLFSDGRMAFSQDRTQGRQYGCAGTHAVAGQSLAPVHSSAGQT